MFDVVKSGAFLMSDLIRLNGTAIRTTGMYQRAIAQDHGPALAEVELVIIIRGTMANRSLRQLLSQEPIRVDIPKGEKSESFLAVIEHVAVNSSGTGESAAYRFDLNLRETPESAAQREAERPAAEEPAAARRVFKVAEPIDESSPDLELSRVKMSGDSSVWATALKQMKAPPSTRPAAAPEPPLTPTERAGIEAILVNLRMDALIDRLEAAGLLRRADVERSFMELVKERFVADAIPVVGEKVAKRAERDLLG